MQIIGIGVDIVEIKRIKKLDAKKRLAEFFFLKDELEIMNRSKNKEQYLASRIACKEAVIKAFPGTLHYHDFKIYKKGKKLDVSFIDKKNIKYKVFLSTSHEFNHAISYAIMTL
ncbi:4'-phosphopantetheinyl transferase superfamily protein [Patescibacteria group bacterium]|nr:4'-phosphopantetheinyl transferase superfamily protein [Patescibacteria group bacterium]